MGTTIKIVPDDAPNADGEWIIVEAEVPPLAPGEPCSWIKTANYLTPFVPKGFHIVATGGRTPSQGDRFRGLEL